jgi:hypothetical protein
MPQHSVAVLGIFGEEGMSTEGAKIEAPRGEGSEEGVSPSPASPEKF